MGYDKGAFGRLTFIRCARGFILMAEIERGLMSPTFAFDHIEDVGCWLVDQYRDSPDDSATCPTDAPST